MSSFLLLETGDYLLQEDDVSRLILQFGVGAVRDLPEPRKVRIKKKEPWDKVFSPKAYEEIQAALVAERAAAEVRPTKEVVTETAQFVSEPEIALPGPDRLINLLQAGLSAQDFAGRFGRGNLGNVYFALPPNQAPVQQVMQQVIPNTASKSKFEAMMERYRGSVDARIGRFRQLMDKYR